eukprot:TRINITY_DN48704_c0_g1_i1.p1 TRINITY_DN48704_c0_g1~~TRINITY_DN48704_c0_g1_i1.p1  ORF type:complete len:791 (-),score=143.38 TRINITY_DN48704_c0_g1_i1:120-2492(-)
MGDQGYPIPDTKEAAFPSLAIDSPKEEAAQYDASSTEDANSAQMANELRELREQLRSKAEEVESLKLRLQGRTPPATPSGSAWQRKPSTSGSNPLSVIIPMGGLGWEFAEAGFCMPKPLVNVVGRPVLLWLLDHLSLAAEDAVYLAVPAAMNRQFGLEKMISRELPAVKVKVVSLAFETRGWVETVLAVARQMTGKELKQPLVTLDCSTIYHGIDVLRTIRDLNGETNASVYFEVGDNSALTASGSTPVQFSYLKLSDSGEILEVKEKAVISSYASCGAHIFKNARLFRTAAETLLQEPEQASKGLYASSLLSWMMNCPEKVSFQGLKVPEHGIAVVSTPPQLEIFIRKVSSGEIAMNRTMRFCFDLDGTLITPTCASSRACNDPNEDSALWEPNQAAIDLVRQLHQAGHTIIIVTSRGMSTGAGVGVAMAHEGHATFALLAKFNIPYHELHFGKPHADVYVDSNAINSHGDINRDLGWNWSNELKPAIDARSFNLVRLVTSGGKESVIKSSTPDVLRGECHWYESIPKELVKYFPELIEISPGESVFSIAMAKVKGVTFSHLVTARLLMPVWLRRLINALHTIHTQTPPPDSAVAKEQKATVAQMCTNYASKVKKRTAAHIALYRELAEETGIDIDKMADVIIRFLEDFESSESCQHAYYIHGDPVFSNVIRSDDDGIVLIDMRGELGKWLTTQGDVHYDLSKVYQSLCGYDFMLLDATLDDTASEMFDALKSSFWEKVKTLYPKVSHRHVRLLTAAHFFTIVPLHEVKSRMVRYLRTSHSMLHVEGLL